MNTLNILALRGMELIVQSLTMGVPITFLAWGNVKGEAKQVRVRGVVTGLRKEDGSGHKFLIRFIGHDQEIYIDINTTVIESVKVVFTKVGV